MGDANLWRDRNKVFVAGLPAHVDDDALYEKFKPFGEMFQSKVVYDAQTGRSKGFGFVTFCEYVHALDAVEKLNQTKWEKRTLNVRFLQPKSNSSDEPTATNGKIASHRPAKVFGPRPEGCTTIYVGNLAYDITEEVLRKVFESKCGSIRAVRFAEHIQTKEFRGFGYVQFYEGEACEAAVKLDGMIVMGRPMNIDYGSRDENTAKQREELQKKLKKGICHKFQQGLCDRGDDCKFAHILKDQDAEELLQPADRPVETSATSSTPADVKTVADADAPVCINFQKGKCKRGEACRFQHLGADAAATATAAGTELQVEEEEVAGIEGEEAAVMEETQADADAPICQNFLKGRCKRGAACRFRHVANADGEAAINTSEQTRMSNAIGVSKPSGSVRVERPTAVVADVAICQNFKRGRCKRGASCRFAHTEQQKELNIVEAVSFYQKRFQSICYNWQKSGSCVRGDKCPFQHEGASSTEKPVEIPDEEPQEEESESTGEDEAVEAKAMKKKEKKEKKAKKDKKKRKHSSDFEERKEKKSKKKKSQ